MADTEVSFVLALPGWEVLDYFGEDNFITSPVVAWAIVAGPDGVIYTSPVTTDSTWALDDTRTLCDPEGIVTQNEDDGTVTRWDTLWDWLDTMKKESAAPPRLRPRPAESEGLAPVVLDNYRRKFQQQGDAL